MLPTNSSASGGSGRTKMPHCRSLFLALILLAQATACTLQRPVIPSPVPTLEAASTSAADLQTATPVPELIDIRSGGFSLAVQPGLEFEVKDDSISISDQRGELIVSLNGRPYVASSYTLQSFLGIYLAEMESRGGTFQQSAPYEIIIDGKNGVAVDFTGTFLDHHVTGKAVAVSPGEDFIVFGLGMSLLNDRESGWFDSGSLTFESILDSIHFKDEVN